jgi:hypothetical protein
MTEVVKKRTAKYDLDISRGTIWGNPYTIGVDGSREDVLELYKTWVMSQPGLMKKLNSLEGLRLGCDCFLPPYHDTCHGDVLVYLIHNQR